MRWLLLKDLQILRRSPLLVATLVLYPVLLALLVGAATNAGPSKPKVAFVNLVPKEKNTFSIGGEKLDASKYAEQLFKSIDPIRVQTREEARALVASGRALGALILPARRDRAPAERHQPLGHASRRSWRSSTTPTTRPRSASSSRRSSRAWPRPTPSCRGG